MSSSQEAEKSWFGAAVDGARVHAGRATRWSDAHLPGGAKLLWLIVGLLLVGLVIWAIRPGQLAVTNGRRGFGGPQPVGAASVAKGDVAIPLNALGTVTPLATVTVRPQVSGQI